MHNKWDEAIDLAKKFQLPQVSNLFMKYTEHLVDQKLLANAVEINVQAKYYLHAAELVFKVKIYEENHSVSYAIISLY